MPRVSQVPVLMLSLLGIPLMTCVLHASQPGDEPSDPSKLELTKSVLDKAERLVTKLGSPKYREREQAHKTLREMGRLALPVISDAAESHPDPEVRSRASLLVPLAVADDMAVRIAVFLKDTEGKYEHDLPAWKEFLKIAGDDPSARELFVLLIKDPDCMNILAGFALGEKEVAARLTARREEIHSLMYPRVAVQGNQRYVPTLADAMVIAFAEGVLNKYDTPRTSPTMTTLNSRVNFRKEIDGQYGPAVQNIIVNWLETRNDSIGLSQALSLARTLNLAELVPICSKILENKGATGINRANAAVQIARNGDKKQIPLLLKVIDDDTVIRRIANQGDTELRDIALAMILVLLDQDHEEFGFKLRSNNASMKFSYTNYTFESEEKREAAFDKWKELSPEMLKALDEDSDDEDR